MPTDTTITNPKTLDEYFEAKRREEQYSRYGLANQLSLLKELYLDANMLGPSYPDNPLLRMIKKNEK